MHKCMVVSICYCVEKEYWICKTEAVFAFIYFFRSKKKSRKIEIICICRCSHQSSVWRTNNNGTQCPTEKSNVWRLEKSKSYKSRNERICWNKIKLRKGNLENENIFGKETLSRKRVRKGKKRCYESLLLATMHL